MIIKSKIVLCANEKVDERSLLSFFLNKNLILLNEKYFSKTHQGRFTSKVIYKI